MNLAASIVKPLAGAQSSGTLLTPRPPEPAKPLAPEAPPTFVASEREPGVVFEPSPPPLAPPTYSIPPIAGPTLAAAQGRASAIQEMVADFVNSTRGVFASDDA